MGLVVVGGVHAPEPLLARRVPEICNENTALTACGRLLGRALGTTHMGGGTAERTPHSCHLGVAPGRTKTVICTPTCMGG